MKLAICLCLISALLLLKVDAYPTRTEMRTYLMKLVLYIQKQTKLCLI